MAGAAITLFMTNTLVSVWQEMSETSPGADATSSPNVGWVVGTTAPTVYSEMDAGNKAANGTFSATVRPDGSLNTTLGDGLRSTNKYTGDFASANWTINGVVIGVTNSGAQDGRLRYRLFRSVNADGSGATEITAGVQIGATITNLSTTQQNSSVTFNPGAFSLTDEYLFIQIGWEITGAGGMSTTDVVFRIGNTATRVVTAAFTPRIEPAGIASAEAFGTAKTEISFSPSGIAGAEAFGTGIVVRYIDAAGIASVEAFGSATVELISNNQFIDPAGIAGAEAFGSALIELPITPSGIAGAEAFGTGTTVQYADASGIAGAEAFGGASIGSGNTIDPTGIASAEAFGTANVSRFVDPAGIASGEAFGASNVSKLIVATGISGAEAFGSGAIVEYVSPTGIASAEAFGTAMLSRAISPVGISSAEAFGSGMAQQIVAPSGIASLEAFGVAIVGPAPKFIDPAGIASVAAFGSDSIALQLGASGIVSQNAFGSAIVQGGANRAQKDFPTFSQSLRHDNSLRWSLRRRLTNVGRGDDDW